MTSLEILQRRYQAALEEEMQVSDVFIMTEEVKVICEVLTLLRQERGTVLVLPADLAPLLP